MSQAATWAAFTAAGLSLVNVLLTARFTRRADLDRWRRDSERPVVVDLVGASRSASEFWSAAASGRERWIATVRVGTESVEIREQAFGAHSEGLMQFRAVQVACDHLDLLAGPRLRAATKDLLRAHQSPAHQLRPASGIEDPWQSWNRALEDIAGAELRVLNAARADLGVNGPSRSPWRRRRR